MDFIPDKIDMPVIPAGTNVLGVGIDLENVDRVRRAIERGGDSFLGKVFSPAEVELCRSRGAHVWESFAARWAAKEAFSKALGTGIGSEVGFSDVAVLSGVRGEPLINLSAHGDASLKKFGASMALVSLSHTKELAAAVVVIIKSTA